MTKPSKAAIFSFDIYATLNDPENESERIAKCAQIVRAVEALGFDIWQTEEDTCDVIWHESGGYDFV